jgi:FkbM family methyltransferase
MNAPRFPDKVCRFLARHEVVLVDVGARGGLDEDLLPLAAAVTAVGFEPEPAEALRLEQHPDRRWRATRIIAAAVGGRVGRGTLHLPPADVGASLLPHNPAMLEAFGHEALHGRSREVAVSTVTLDELKRRGELARMDYLKLDVEGAELDVLRASLELLDNCKAVKVEGSFLPQRTGQPLVAELAEFLLARGFEWIDVADVHRWRRRPVPAHPYRTRFTMPYSRGQLAQCDLLFFKRAAQLADAGERGILALIAASLGFLDYAVGVLRAFPDVAALWKEEGGIDIEQELVAFSRKLGRRAVWAEIRRTLRGLVPLLRAAAGRLPFTPPSRPY